jgi:alkylhydroperoxidase/carboxymuconolactone decarboxylase family protein YurZ
MYLPKIYEKFSQKYPDILKDYQQLGKSCRESGPLDPKCQDLVNLGIAIGANSRGAVMSGHVPDPQGAEIRCKQG